MENNPRKILQDEIDRMVSKREANQQKILEIRRKIGMALEAKDLPDGEKMESMVLVKLPEEIHQLKKENSDLDELIQTYRNELK